MINKEVEQVFFDEGYRFCKVRPEEIAVFYKYDQEGFHVVIVVDMDHGGSLNDGQQRVMEERVKGLFFRPESLRGILSDFPEEFPVHHVEVLTLLLGGDMEQIRTLCSSCNNTWGYLSTQARLLIYENQPGDFWGLRQALENMHMSGIPGKMDDPGAPKKSVKAAFLQTLRDIRNRKDLPYATVGIVTINIVVYLVLEWLGDTEDGLFIALHGGMYPTFVLYDHKWWRILTAGFIHFGVAHLANNMVIFSAIGSRLERAVGHIRMLVIYMLSLVGGGLLSYGVMVYTGDYAVSAGTSGAVFGAIGGLLWAVLLHRGRFEGLTTRGLIFMIVLSLYYGFTSVGVDNWAHIGGIATGFVVTAILYHRKQQRC